MTKLEASNPASMVCRRFVSCEVHKADTRDASILPMLLLHLSAWASSSNRKRLELNRRPRTGQAKRRNLRCLHGDPLLPPSPPSRAGLTPAHYQDGLLPHSIPAVGKQSFDVDGSVWALAASNLQASCTCSLVVSC